MKILLVNGYQKHDFCKGELNFSLYNIRRFITSTFKTLQHKLCFCRSSRKAKIFK